MVNGPSASPQLTSGRLIIRNTIWSLLGRGAPLFVALFAIPILLQGLGETRFGILNLGWLVVGYLSLFDLGVGRALTLVAAERLGQGREQDIPALYWKSLAVLALLGIGGAIAAFSLSGILVHRILSIDPALTDEAEGVFRLLAISLPMQLTASGTRGLLEAHQRFKLIGATQIMIGVYSFVAPLIMLAFTHRLIPIITALLVGRFVIWLIYLVHSMRLLPAWNLSSVAKGESLRSLLRVGGWMTVSNIVGPLMDTADRFLVGALVSVAAVAYYSTPFDLAAKLLIIPTALSAVIFPAFASTFSGAPQHTRRLFLRSLRITYVILVPIVLLLVLFAREFLTLWLGEAFAERSTHVLQIISIGVLANCIAQLPFALIQGGSRADLTARLHLIEFPLCIALTWLLIQPFGITGAAIAWTGRVIVDCAVLLAMSGPLLGQRRIPWESLSGPLGLLGLIALGLIPMPTHVKIPCAALALAGYAYLSLTQVLVKEDRDTLRALIGTQRTRLREAVLH